MRRTLSLLVGSAIGIAAPGIASQDTIRISDDAYCDCEVELEHVVTLGDIEGPGALRNTIKQVARDARGIYYVLPWQSSQIDRFEPGGAVLSPISSEGEGPGESRRITTFALAGDSIFVFDPGAGRMTVYRTDGGLVRTAFIASGYTGDALYSSGLGLIINARGMTEDSFGRALHVIDSDGSRLASFGGTVMDRPDPKLGWTRKIGLSGDRTWSAFEDSYVINEWTLDGVQGRVLVRDAEWFLPREHASWGGPDEPFEPQIQDIEVDRRGHVRVTMIRGGPRWADLLPPIPFRDAMGDPIYQIDPGIGLFESIIEIIDPEAGTLFARGVVSQEIFGFVDAEHVFSYQEDENRNPTIGIWRIRLERRD